MIFIKIDTMGIAKQICNICEQYKDYFDIDVIYGRQVIDATSILGVASLAGNIVRINPITDDAHMKSELIEELKGVGAYEIKD